MGSVIDGRDIGTVIVPNAEIKFFVDADVKIRAHRRTLQLKLNDRMMFYFDAMININTDVFFKIGNRRTKLTRDQN